MEPYPKIQTLYNRSKDDWKVIVDQFRCPEFALIQPYDWILTEKVDGTNIRIILSSSRVEIRGRTDRAQLPQPLFAKLTETFTPELFSEAFSVEEDTVVTLYGEGYGAKIQKGGIYRPNQSFRLFDVRVGSWWLNWDSVIDVAQKMNIAMVPTLDRLGWIPHSLDDLASLFTATGSIVALEDSNNRNARPEGIVARTNPLLLRRNGERLMWKLKYKDF